MVCSKCGIAAPDNLLALGGVWACDNCASPPKHITHELHDQYNKEGPGRYLYISELTNNLDKVAQYFTEEVDMSNPYGTVTLVVPEGIDQLQGQYDAIYLDSGSMNEQEVINRIRLADFGLFKLVNPTTQIVL